jgi:hypothetical protein
MGSMVALASMPTSPNNSSIMLATSLALFLSLTATLLKLFQAVLGAFLKGYFFKVWSHLMSNLDKVVSYIDTIARGKKPSVTFTSKQVTEGTGMTDLSNVTRELRRLKEWGLLMVVPYEQIKPILYRVNLDMWLRRYPLPIQKVTKA